VGNIGCPDIFKEASYYGGFKNNLLHGRGSLFLNSREKIIGYYEDG